jgi:hypothetical protein
LACFFSSTLFFHSAIGWGRGGKREREREREREIEGD